MSEDDAEDLDGMWDDLSDGEEGAGTIGYNISENLSGEAGKIAQEVHAGDVDAAK